MDYSQHNESTFLLNYIRKNHIKVPETFIEIGAVDGVLISNGKMFVEMGWQVVFIEPNYEYYKSLVWNYNENYLVQCYNYAVSNENGRGYLDIPAEMPTHATLSDKGQEVEIISLLSLVDKTKFTKIGIMSIDVEGAELNIILQLAKLDPDKLPYFIIIESNTLYERDLQIEVLRENYYLINVLNVNTLWVRQDISDNPKY
jgi:FkbM family methyltransferase